LVKLVLLCGNVWLTLVVYSSHQTRPHSLVHLLPLFSDWTILLREVFGMRFHHFSVASLAHQYLITPLYLLKLGIMNRSSCLLSDKTLRNLRVVRDGDLCRSMRGFSNNLV
jgi:hypothetical protein